MSRTELPPGERGSASLWLLLAALLLVVAAGVTAVLGQAAVLRHRAGSAADLAALAAADSVLLGEATACRRAALVAHDARARVVSCRVRGGVSDVVVHVQAEGALARFGPVQARARAGPGDRAPPPPPTHGWLD